MVRKLMISLAVALSLSACESMNIGGMIGAATTLASAASISDAEIRTLGIRSQQQLDAKNRIAPANSKYAKRLNRLTRNLRTYEGHQLNYQVYMTNDVNAFALPNGGIRVYSGLMDMMNDDELLYVIGHEIGHVVHGHSLSQTRTRLMSSAAIQAAASSGGGALASLSSGALGQLAHQFVNAQYSQSQEYEADAYGVKVLQAQGKSPRAAVSALRKIAQLNDSASIFLTHPQASARADRIERMYVRGR